MSALKTLSALFTLSCLACTALTSPAAASPSSGVKYDVHRVEGYSTDTFYVSFWGGEEGAILISGDGDTDLDLLVFDEYGNLVGSDTDRSDDCVVRLLPRWTGTFRIEVRNLGHVYNQYQIGCI